MRYGKLINLDLSKWERVWAHNLLNDVFVGVCVRKNLDAFCTAVNSTVILLEFCRIVRSERREVKWARG